MSQTLQSFALLKIKKAIAREIHETNEKGLEFFLSFSVWSAYFAGNCFELFFD
ncbi:MAG: hypothetical protein JWN60_2185 [Acidobacteria bacterium]|jgi:hypothetical protein|nr:hypothetical protein [Acidobacteriota bacterium]